MLREVVTIFIGLLFPQLMGFLGFRWIRTRESKVLKFLFLLIPPLSFFIIAYFYWGNAAKEIAKAGQRVCGMFYMMSSFSILAGTTLHLSLSIILFFILSKIWKRRQ